MRRSLKPPPNSILVIYQHGELLWKVPLRKAVLTIGRSPQNDIVLDGPTISRQQARLCHTDQGWYIFDLTSTNGTLLAGTPLTPNQPHKWQSGPSLYIDEYTLRLGTTDAVPPDLSAPVMAPPLSPILEARNEENSRRFNTLVLMRQNAKEWGTGNLVLVGLLILAWVLALTAVPPFVPIQIASWITYVALIITPGYLLADMIGVRLELDIMEKLGLATPLGIAILAIPGIVALLLHQTLFDLAISWAIISGLILFCWILFTLLLLTSSEAYASRYRQSGPLGSLWLRLSTYVRALVPAHRPAPWVLDERLMLLLLLLLYLLGLPALTQAKMDGDALAVSTFTAEALAGHPLNQQEPLFGTDHGPGVRMIFNQYMPLSYLWSFFSAINPLTITAVASRSMLGFFALLATYTLGKAAGGGSRRFGLFTALLQMLFYLAAPFLRADNVSLFFFERINADKFMVVVLLLPPIFALAMRYLHQGRRDVWLIAALASFAASTIHPLSSAMLALALAAFGAFHILLNLQHITAWRRGGGLAMLVVAAMTIPMIQLYFAQGEAALASAYPDSFEGWQIEERRVPVLPFLDVKGLDVYGRLPPISQYEPGDANTPTNPFLLMRFAVNMDRQRLIVFDIDSYMLNPRLILEPLYLLALLLLPFLLGNVRHDITAQFVLSTTTAVLVVMFVPSVTPIIGGLVMPWILWRFIWLLPYTLIIALSLYRLLNLPRVSLWVANTIQRFGLMGRNEPNGRLLPKFAAVTNGAYSLLAIALLLFVLLLPLINRTVTDLRYRPASPYFYPNPSGIMSALIQLTEQHGEAMVLADQDMSVSVAAYVANADIVAHRVPTTSEIFPADEQDVALQRLIDQTRFYESDSLTSASVQTLERYSVRFLILPSSSRLEQQVRLMPDAFSHLVDDTAYSLYQVNKLPSRTDSLIQANDAMHRGDWQTAAQHYSAVRQSNPNSLVAITGLAHIARLTGETEIAANYLQEALSQSEHPTLRFQLGMLYAERGDTDSALPHLLKAQQALPTHSSVHIAVGNACVLAALTDCADNAYQMAVANHSLPDDAARIVAIGDLWRQQGYLARAIALYEEAVRNQPTQFNKLVLVRAYQEAERYDEAAAVLTQLRRQYPLSPDISLMTANLLNAQGAVEQAVNMYQKTIFLQRLQLYESSSTYAILAQVLIDNGRWHEASDMVHQLRLRSPANATGHRLHGDLMMREGNIAEARKSYARATQLGPFQIDVIFANTRFLQQTSTPPDEILGYLQNVQGQISNEPALYLTLGDQYQRVGQPEEAILAYLEAVIRLNPTVLADGQRSAATQLTRAFAYARMAQLYEAMGNISVGMGYYEAAVTAAPHAVWTHTLIGDAYLRRNDQERAMHHYKTALEQNPNLADVLVRQARLLRQRGEFDAANGLYAQAASMAHLQLEQSFQVSTYPVQSLLTSPYLPNFSNETVDNAALLADSFGVHPAELIRQGDENMDLVRSYVRLISLSSNGEESIEQFRGWIREGETAGWRADVLAQYYRGLGDLYVARAEGEKARSAYQTAVELAPWWPDARLSFAQTLLDQNSVDEAVDHLQAAYRLSPGSVDTAVVLANALSQQGEELAAEALFEETAAAYPGNQLATLAAGRYWQGRSQWDLAEKYFSLTLRHNAGAVEAYVGLADTLIAQGVYQEALHLLQDARALDAQNVDVFVSIGNLSQRTGSNEEALMWYQRGVEVSLANKSIHEPLIDALLASGDINNALILIVAGLEARPNDPGLTQRMAQAQLVVGEDAPQLEQADYRIQLVRATYFEEQGQFLSAISAFESTLALGEEDVTPFLALHRLYLLQGKVASAEQVLSQGLTQFPYDPELTVAMANFKARQNEPERAIALLEEGYLKGNTPLQFLLAMAQRYMTQGDFAQAEVRLDEALRLAPHSGDALAVFGELALQRGDEASAVQFLETATSHSPGSPGIFILLAQAYEQSGRLDEAHQAYDRVLALAPSFEAAIVGKASLYFSRGQVNEAAAVYESGLAILPTSGSLLTNYAALRVEHGENEAAISLLEQAGQFAKDAETAVATARLWQTVGPDENAEQLLLAALEREPGSLDLLTALGDLYLDQSNYLAAEQQYEQLVALAPGNPVGYVRLGNLANERGDRTAAQNFAALAHQIDPSTGNP